jgi:hypothetical protein
MNIATSLLSLCVVNDVLDFNSDFKDVLLDAKFFNT